MTIYQNLKNGDLYILQGVAANCTNDCPPDKKTMVRYQSLTTGEDFVREAVEFHQKFVLHEGSPSEALNRQGQKFNALLPVLIGTIARLDSALGILRDEAETMVGESILRDYIEENDQFILELAVANMFMPMILKVQAPVSSNDPDAPYLVYNESRSLDTMITVDEGVVSMFGNDLKVFVQARVWVDGTLQIVGRAEDQSW